MTQPLPRAEWLALDPGIRATVEWLRSWHFETCDSGDGTNKRADPDALPHPHVHIRVPDPGRLAAEADRLASVLRERDLCPVPVGPDAGPQVQATYDPVDGTAFLSLYHVDDALLFGGTQEE